MKPHKTRRVLVCSLCGYESEPLGTANSIDQEKGSLAHDEMNQHIAENHGDNPGVRKAVEAAEPQSLALIEYYTLEIRRNPR